MRPLAVGLDAGAALRPDSGAGRYTVELIRALGALGPECQLDLTLLANRFGRRFAADLPGRLVNPGLPHRVLTFAWRHLGWPAVEAFTGPLDVFHASDWIQPPLRKAASVTTIHDMGALVHPEWYTAPVQAVHRDRNRAAARDADSVIAVSAFTRAEFLRLHDVDPSKVRTVHSGVSGRFRPAPPEAVRRARSAHGLARPYLLYVGTWERRKNIPGLLEIFERVAREEPDVDLALVGAGTHGRARRIHRADAWTARQVKRLARTRGLGKRVRVVGRVDPGTLVALYSGAAVFVFPTCYEGFGFPALEAMACGAPVVASDNSALPEVVGDAGGLVDPRDVDAFASEVLGLLRSAELARERRARGLERAARFTWARTAKATLEVYADLAGK